MWLGYKRLLKYLEKQGASLNVKSTQNHSLIHVSIERLNFEILVYLCSKIDLDVLNDKKQTPLIYSVLKKWVD